MKEEKIIHINAKHFTGIIFTIILVAALIIGFVVMNSKDKNNNPTTDLPNTTIPTTVNYTNIPASAISTDKVVILSDTMDLDKANDRHKIIFGKVQNTGTTRALNVWVTATLYNLNGTLIGKETTRPFINELDPNQVSFFQINVYDSYDTSTAAYRLSVVSQ